MATIRAGVAAAAVLISNCLAGGAAKAAPVQAPGVSSCPDGYATEAGTCAEPVSQVPLTAAQQAQVQAKLAGAAAATQPEASGGTGGAVAYNLPAPDGGSYDFKMSEIANMTIYKEGQGNGKKSYTCGPSATRNMVAAMYKHRDGAYKDFGEAQFATWEGTTTSGTARANIAAALNNHFSSFGSWTTSRPSSKDSLLGTIIADTKAFHQAVILNVDTEEYSFFNGKALNHFDFAYGFDNTGATTDYIYVGEEWDPIYIYGSSSYGNPYGKHKEALGHVYQAVVKSSIHGIVS